MASWPSKNLTSHWQLLRQTHIIVFYCFLIIIVPRSSSCQQLDSAELSSYQLTYLLSIELEETNIMRVTATPESRKPYMNSFVDKKMKLAGLNLYLGSLQMSVCLLNVDLSTFIAVNFSFSNSEMTKNLLPYLFLWKIACICYFCVHCTT